MELLTSLSAPAFGTLAREKQKPHYDPHCQEQGRQQTNEGYEILSAFLGKLFLTMGGGTARAKGAISALGLQADSARTSGAAAQNHMCRWKRALRRYRGYSTSPRSPGSSPPSLPSLLRLRALDTYPVGGGMLRTKLAFGGIRIPRVPVAKPIVACRLWAPVDPDHTGRRSAPVDDLEQQEIVTDNKKAAAEPVGIQRVDAVGGHGAALG
jgi:hypothetical protein